MPETHSKELLDAFDKAFESIEQRYNGRGPKAKFALVRRLLGTSQRQFAEEFGIPMTTIRNWESPDRGEPTGAAKAFIEILAEDPYAVRDLAKKAKYRDMELSQE